MRISKLYFLIVFIAGTCLVSCNNRAGNAGGKSVASKMDEIQQFIKHFTVIHETLKTDGAGYYFTKSNILLNAKPVLFSDSNKLYKADLSFLLHSSVTVPDSFYPAVYFMCGSYYVCMIRGFNGKLDPNLSSWNSSLLAIDTSGITDVLEYSTMQDPGDTYKSCWIQNLDSGYNTEIILRSMSGEGDPAEGGLSSPEVYKITNGKFKAVTNIKIDTTAFNFN